MTAFCKKDELECANHECLPHDLWCDGHLDCSDNSDEWNCGKLSFVHLAGIVVDGNFRGFRTFIFKARLELGRKYKP